MMEFQIALVVGCCLFAGGLALVMASRHVILALMGIESMLMGAGVNAVCFWAWRGGSETEGIIMVLFVMTVAAGEAALGLALALNIYRHYKTVNLTEIRRMKG